MRNKEFEPGEVIDAAMNVFWQHGFAGTSVQDLVESTGLSRSSIYNTFENKQDLYQQALRRYQHVTEANAALLAGPGSPKDLIRQLLMRVVEDELGDPQRRGCLVANATLELAGKDEAVAEMVSYNFQRLQAALKKLIERGQKTRQIGSKKSPEALAQFFVNTMQGLRILSKGTPRQHRRKCLLNVIDVALGTLQ